MQKFLAKCRQCKRFDDGICSLSNFEDKSCAFIYKHLKEERIDFCDVFKRAKANTSLQKMMKYAAEIAKLGEHSRKSFSLNYTFSPKKVDKVFINVYFFNEDVECKKSIDLYSFWSIELNDKQIELIKEEMEVMVK